MRKTAVNVLHLASNPRYAGAESHVASLISALKTLGDVKPFLAVFHDGQLVDEAREMGVPVEVIPLRWVFDITSITRLLKIFRRWNIDCLHSHGYKANVIGALAAQKAHIPCVVRTEHGRIEPFTGFDSTKMRFYEMLNTWVGNRLTDRIITVSDDLRDHLKARYPGKAIVTVHNGIRPIGARSLETTQEKRKCLGIDESSPLIGIVGRLMPVKNHSDFLRAAAMISRTRPDARFVIVGEGPLLSGLKQEARELGLSDVVHFLGFRPDALDWLAAMDLLVFSSLSEGVPYTLLEAMSLGIPVIGTAVGGLPEVIDNGATGLLVKPGSSEALAQACLRLLNDPEQLSRFAKTSRERCTTYFSELRMAEAVRTIYTETLSRKNTRHEMSRSQGAQDDLSPELMKR